MVSLGILKSILAELDVENDLNFATFFENLMENSDCMDDDVEKISEFLQTDLGISSDAELLDLDDEELEQLAEAINKLMD